MTPWRSSAAFVGSFGGHSGALHTGVTFSRAAIFTTSASDAPPSAPDNGSATTAEGSSPASPTEAEGEIGEPCALHPEKASKTAPAPAHRHHIIASGRRTSSPPAQDFYWRAISRT